MLFNRFDRTRDALEGETACTFVSSKGLMKLCDVHQPLPNDYSKRWKPGVLRRHKPGQRIYVHATALADFVRRGLPKIKHRFVLVSGDSVADVSPENLGQDTVHAVLDHPLLDAWYSQNLAHEHPKLHPMPLGLDYHTISRNRRPHWGPSASAKAQDDTLHLVRKSGPALIDRQPLGYSNWHFALKNGDRADVIKAFPNEASFFETDVVPRTKSWQRNQDYFFTISPRGVGMDCHRTWESILLGSVPIIPDLPINRLFESLPVVVVNDWSSVTHDFLRTEKKRILSQSYDFAPVLLETWRRKLFGLPALPPLEMTYQEFMNLGFADFDQFTHASGT